MEVTGEDVVAWSQAAKNIWNLITSLTKGVRQNAASRKSAAKHEFVEHAEPLFNEMKAYHESCVQIYIGARQQFVDLAQQQYPLGDWREQQNSKIAKKIATWIENKRRPDEGARQMFRNEAASRLVLVEDVPTRNFVATCVAYFADDDDRASLHPVFDDFYCSFLEARVSRLLGDLDTSGDSVFDSPTQRLTSEMRKMNSLSEIEEKINEVIVALNWKYSMIFKTYFRLKASVENP